MTMPNGAGLLQGKVLFLAGAGSQTGAATAGIAAREGAKVALAARSEDIAREVADEICANATLPFVVGGDVGSVAASLNCIGRSGGRADRRSRGVPPLRSRLDHHRAAAAAGERRSEIIEFGHPLGESL